MIHELKERTIYLDKVISGEKTFEVRAHDRDYKVGDYLALNEYLTDAVTGKRIGMGDRCCLVKVTDILIDPEFVKDGYVIMSIQPCRIETHNRLPAEVYGTEDRNNE